jgi:lipid II:glycine glycyltransferase (peptidoglycan interpeptide bridge formation enzyme)
LDLTLDDHAFRRQMTPKGRYNAGLALRRGVTVRQSSDTADIARFFALFQETSHRQGFYAEPYGFFVNLANTLFAAGMASLFFAESGGETLGAVLALFYGRRATYLYGGSSLDHRDAMPNYAIQMAVAQEAKLRGCVEYDLYGYDPHGLPDHLYAGISRFKRQFGGTPRASIGARDLLFYDRIAGRMLSRLRTSKP